MALFTAEQALKFYEDTNAKYGGKIKMSDWDMAQLTKDPDRGVGLVTNKAKWLDADAVGDAAGKASAHKANEDLRYGSSDTAYSGGADGSELIPFPKDGPSSFSTADFTSQYDTPMNDALNKYLNMGEYTSAHTGDIDRLKTDILNQKDYNYNPANDPAYQAAYKQMIREANRATANTLGQVSAATGGMPSTAAVSAAQQAGDNYRATFGDNVANFMANDYQRYADNRADKYNQLSAIMQLDDADYQKWVDKVGLSKDAVEMLNTMREQDYNKWESNRNFNYGKFTDDLSYQTDKQNAEHQKIADQINTLSGLYDIYVETNPAKAKEILAQIEKLTAQM